MSFSVYLLVKLLVIVVIFFIGGLIGLFRPPGDR